MRNATAIWSGQHAVDQTLAAMEEMERYCTAHPRSPAATRRPRLSIRGRTFVALLGPAIEEGIAGFGDTVRRRCAPLMHNTRALSRRLPIGISTTQALQAFEQEHAADQGPHENGRRGRICREKPAQVQRRMMWIARMRL